MAREDPARGLRRPAHRPLAAVHRPEELGRAVLGSIGGHLPVSGTGRNGRGARAALRELVATGVRACVVAPERELRRWFSWLWYWTDSIIDDLVRDGRARRLDGHIVAAGEQE